MNVAFFTSIGLVFVLEIYQCQPYLAEPTYLVISSLLMKRLCVYIDSYREVVSSRAMQHRDDLFLKEDGTRLSSEHISSCYRYPLDFCN